MAFTGSLLPAFLNDAALSLHHQRPDGRKPPLPTEMGFPRQDIPLTTIDAPDPEEEFEERDDSIDDRPTLNYKQTRSVSEPLPNALPIAQAERQSRSRADKTQESVVETNTAVFSGTASMPEEVGKSDTLPVDRLPNGLTPKKSSDLPTLSVQSESNEKPADEALLEAVDYLTTSEAKALRLNTDAAFESGERPMTECGNKRPQREPFWLPSWLPQRFLEGQPGTFHRIRPLQKSWKSLVSQRHYLSPKKSN